MTIQKYVDCFYKRKNYKPYGYSNEKYIDDLSTKMDFFMQIPMFPFKPAIGRGAPNISTRISEVSLFLNMVETYYEMNSMAHGHNREVDKKLRGSKPFAKKKQLIGHAQKVLDDLKEHGIGRSHDTAELSMLLNAYIEELENGTEKYFVNNLTLYKKDKSENTKEDIRIYLDELKEKYQLDVSAKVLKELIDYI